MATTTEEAERELTRLRQRVAECELERIERQAVERELTAAKARLEHLITVSPAAIYVAETAGDYATTFVSGTVQRQLGHSPLDFIADPGFWKRHIHDEDASRLLDDAGHLKAWPTLLETGSAIHEYRFRHRDGSYRWMRDEMSLIRDADGSPREIVGYWTDITPQKLYTDALHHLIEGTARATGKDFLRALTRQLAETLGIRYAWVGQRAGTDGESIRTLAVWAGDDFAEDFDYRVINATSDNGCISADCCHPDELRQLLHANPLFLRADPGSCVCAPLVASTGKPLGVIAVMHDAPFANRPLAQSILAVFADRIAAEMERQKAEQDIRNLKDRLLEAQRLAHIGNWHWILEGDDLWWSDEGYRIFGAEAADFAHSYESFLDFVHPDDRARVRAAVEQALAEKGAYYIEHRVLRPDGTVRHCLERGKVICGADARPVRMIGTVQDITDLRQAYDSLASTERQLEHALLFKEKILEQSPVGIAIYDANGQCISANDAIGRLIGATHEQVLAQNYHSIEPFKASGMYQKIEQAIARKRNERVELSTTSTFGKPVEFNCHLAPFSSGGNDYLLLMVDDLSELKHAKRKSDQLLQQNRRLSRCLFEAQETERKLLARELHDELGQWLTVIQLNTQLISELNAGVNAEINDCARAIAEGSQRIHQGIRGMIQSLRPALLDELGLNDSLHVLVAQWQQHHPGIACRLTTEDGLNDGSEISSITAYRIIQEALNNVAKHSGASAVTVALHREHPDKAPGGWLRIDIQDNGVGLPVTGLGNGMGLTWMRERTLAAGGDFFLDQPEGSGLRISACLPLHHDYTI